MAKPKEEEEEEIEDTGFPEIWKPEKEGEEIKGIVVVREEGQYGLHLVIKEAKTEERMQTPAHMLLQRKLMPILTGDIIRIVYAGQVTFPTGKKPANDYKVFRSRKL